MNLYSMKTFKLNRVKSVMIGALALCYMGWMSQAANAQALTIGVVDEEKLGQNYKKYRDAVADIEKRAQGLDEQLASRLWLTAEEGKKFDELIVKPTRTAAEDGDVKKLVEGGAGRQTEYNGLVGKLNKTDADKARMKEIETIAEGNKAGMEALQNNLYAQMKKVQEETDNKYTTQANTVIKQVAEEKKLGLVVRKVAVVWSADSIDVTDEVLKRLNG